MCVNNNLNIVTFVYTIKSEKCERERMKKENCTGRKYQPI